MSPQQRRRHTRRVVILIALAVALFAAAFLAQALAFNAASSHGLPDVGPRGGASVERLVAPEQLPAPAVPL